MKWLFTLLCCVPAIQAETVGVVALLNRVAERYRHLTTYVIEIQRRNSGHLITAGISDPPAPVNKIILARSDSMLHYELTGPYIALTWITDGRQTWSYRRDLNEYTVEPASEWRDPPSRESRLPYLDWEYVSKFRALAGLAGKADLFKTDVPPDAICSGPTALIKLQLGTSKAPTTELLRIDTDSALVCHSSVDSTRLAGRTISVYTTTILWNYKQLSGPVDASLFAFTPSKHTKLVQRFRSLAPSP